MDSEGEDGEEEPSTALGGGGGLSGGRKHKRAVLAMATKFLPLYEVKNSITEEDGEGGGGDRALSLRRGKKGGMDQPQHPQQPQQQEDAEEEQNEDDEGREG